MPEYYEALCITRGAQPEGISKAYRMASLKYHPDNWSHTEDAQYREMTQRFRFVAEAYEVLSNPKLRAVYDCYGADGLAQMGYKFSGDAMKVFGTFFGVDSPFQLLGGHQYFTKSSTSSAQKGCTVAPVLVTLSLTIENVYLGGNHMLTYKAHHFDSHGAMALGGQAQERTLEIYVPRGIREGTVLTYPGCGNTQDGSAEPGEVRATIRVLQHPRFEIVADTSDLLFRHAISLKEALCGFGMTILTPDNRKVDIFIDEVVHPGYVRVVRGEGMPVYDAQTFKTCGGAEHVSFGDLRITFTIEFPKYITANQKAELTRILSVQE